MESPRGIELLAPAANVEIAREAILHGADAIYIGASSHGARKNAANSIDDIRRLVEFAHPFRARVYVTVNTIVYDKELKHVERLIRELYEAGADALIVQDMGILRLEIPPIELHASTQCHIASPQKALFLQNAGFAQLVLARELSLEEIREIHRCVNVPLEAFVHGALCVSYSGRCHASQMACGRSANRGECAQICRLPFNLSDVEGKMLIKNLHLLSLKDLNRLDRLEDLLESGISSMKIEGRLKDAAYVKNTVAAYSQRLDEIIAARPGKYFRKSSGISKVDFTPDLYKSFNRSFTGFYIDGYPKQKLSSPHTPKSLGEPIGDISVINNGDGIAFFDKEDNYIGVRVNRVDSGRLYLADRNLKIPKGTQIYRTSDRLWEMQMAKVTATRKIDVRIHIDSSGATISDSRGLTARVALGFRPEKSINRPTAMPGALGRFGDTIYHLEDFSSDLPEDAFIPASKLADLRHRLVETLDNAASATYQFNYRLPENKSYRYPETIIDYKDNVANRLAAEFYRDHGAKIASYSVESTGGLPDSEKVVMTSRHCILRDLGLCLKRKHPDLRLPLTLSSGTLRYQLCFDCRNCQMTLLQN